MLIDEAQFQRAVNDLTQAIQMTIEAVVPLSQPSPHSRRWWNKELSQLKKQVNWLASQSYKFRAIVNHSSHSEFRMAQGKYGDAIKRAAQEEFS